MANFRKRQRIRTIVYSKATIIILLILVVVAARATWGVYKKSKEAELRRTETETRLEELAERERMLSEEVEGLSTKEGIERELREKFGVVKEGERVIVIVDAEASPEPPAESALRGFLNKILSVFGIGDESQD